MDAVIPSYLAKANRAQKHLIDLQAEIDRWAALKPYAVTESIEGKKKAKVRRLTLMLSPENTEIPVITADAIYNTRSSLDHLMAAMVPANRRAKVMFPVFWRGVWEPVVPGENKQRVKDRERWASCVKGLPADAVTCLQRLQPPDDGGDEAELHRLAVLNGLSNRDRHQKLIEKDDLAATESIRADERNRADKMQRRLTLIIGALSTTALCLSVLHP
jgi:hypothetical protein